MSNDRQAKIAAATGPQRNSNRTILGAVVALLVVIGVIVGIVVGTRGNDEPAAEGNATNGATSGEVKLPKGVADPHAPVVATNDGVLRPGVPTLQIFEDFQCPACANLEQTYGPMIQQEAADGNIALSYRIMTFLDNNLNNDASLRAANGLGCAITGGVGEPYHNIVYANQPEQEGDGWTDDQLKQFGADAGLSGDAKTQFDKCVDEGTYKGWAQLSNDAAFNEGITGTPTIYVNGKELPSSALQSEQALKEALTNPQQ